MSNSCWSELLAQKLATLSAALDRSPRLALLGIGNELNGDDAAGVLVVRGLMARLASRPHLLLLEAGLAPEAFTAPLRRFAPDCVILIDAALLDDTPGAVMLVDWRQTDGLSATTHTLPPSVLVKFLQHELGCAVELILIQPEDIEFDHPVTPGVLKAVDHTVTELARLLA
ncbi:hydrogenase 3 maturation peptidase Hycl. Aspartic peptidase. MEROPS family A31 [Longilinea arvoryzae]|uniref:Hydrogenase 3 maturation peptidase Hycl. Aspartic peptidase. MEROPS family A31 n=1 Tax=Longilinea arvoryzae TaxID=360412 RepID=A0A0S7BCP3_9CHLR|nr:hydrogenase maturation protease [Longilinea arvoryzae]GAP15454.1 hydrogenase 3 maturation peptidase Hycl. Aspartic peptidase. MEROPS family A31 [Longilinea arvoryzae]